MASQDQHHVPGATKCYPLVAMLVVLFAVCLSATAQAADDLLIADFEGQDYGDWKTTGEAFGPGPARGTLAGQMAVSGFAGQGLVNSFFKGDRTTGTLTSPPFKIERKYVQFLLGGGNHPGQTCVNLLIGGRSVRTACHDSSEGSERLEPRAWDVSELAGQEAVLEIVDNHTGGWGHVNVDQIVQTDNKLPGWMADAARELMAEKPYLLLPIKNGAAKARMRVIVDGAAQREFDIELADSDPDWWAFLDISAWKGKPLKLTVNRLREGSQALEQVQQSETPADPDRLYQESLRPQFHFSARRGWLNDPNGLTYHDGEYHLFFQHNPYGWNWGNMHWGHAVSDDLVHWKELPIALYPDALGTMFSGSAVVDEKNTAGFQNGSRPPLVCIYTAAGEKFSQCLAFSNDRGRTWQKYEGNPVLAQQTPGNRDPKVFWHEPAGKWIMALYLDKNDFALFGSPDLKRWDKLSDVKLPGAIECPELFAIALDGKAEQTRWIFYGGNGHYLVGDFDGQKFTPESGPHLLHHGNCFYASQTFNHIPTSDGRRILIPWGQVNLPGMPFNQMMGVPVELTLRGTPEGPRLAVQPVRELEKLRREKFAVEAAVLEEGNDPLWGYSGELLDLEVEVTPNIARDVTFTLRGIEVVYDAKREVLKCLDKQAPLKLRDGRVHLRILVDRASIDIFGNRGELYMPLGTLPPSNDHSLAATSSGGAAVLETLIVYKLKPIWETAPTAKSSR